MMPAYNFQNQFVSLILEGAKRQTIRKRRKHQTRVGHTLQLYTGQRTSQCKMIATRLCTAVVPVKIYPEIGRVVLNGKMLSLDDTMRFAVRDGFANHIDFFKFFKRYPRAVLENELEVICWR